VQIKKKPAVKTIAKQFSKQLKSAYPSPKKIAAVKTAKKMSTKVVNEEIKAPTKVKLPPEFSMKQVKEVIALIKDAGVFTTFSYKTEEFEIELSVGGSAQLATPIYAASQPALIAAPAQSSASVTTAQISHAVDIATNERLVVSPMVGTFFRRPSPDSAPFVEVGDIVTPTTDVCIVEVMKLLSTIPAGCGGQIRKILVEDGASIDVGQSLMIIELT